MFFFFKCIIEMYVWKIFCGDSFRIFGFFNLGPALVLIRDIVVVVVVNIRLQSILFVSKW